LIAVAAVSIIVAVVSLVTCAGKLGNPSLDNLVKDDAEKVVKSLEGFEIVKLYDTTYYTPANMKDTISSAAKAFDDGSRNAANKAKENIAKQNPWAVSLRYEEEEPGKFRALKLEQIQGEINPSMVVYVTYRVLNNPTTEDIYKIAKDVVQIDKITFGSDPTQAGESNYGQNIYCFGTGEGPGTTINIRVDKLDDVYEIMIIVYNMDEVKTKTIESAKDANANRKEYFRGETSFPK
jgi:hypothetical protein